METLGLASNCGSRFIKVKCMPERVIYKDSTRCMVESLRAGINKRKATSVHTPVAPLRF